jgi:hypothetical protein
MTKEYYQNLRRSLRAFCYNLDTSITWYLDTIDETATEDTFGIVKTSTQGFEDEIKPYYNDMINLNIFAKAQATAELKAGTLIEALKGRNIMIKDYLNYEEGETTATLDNILITRIDVTNVGNTEGYYQINLGIYYQQIGE